MKYQRGVTFERQWDIFFILATGGRDYTVREIHAFLNKKWIVKTIQRDLHILEKYGVERTLRDGISRYKYKGPKGPFVKPKFKYCPKCRKTKDIDEFHKMWSGEFGRKIYCIECINKYNRKYYAKNREYMVERLKIRRERMKKK